MKKGTIILLCIGGALLLLICFGISKYNGLVEAETAVDQKWSDVETQYQRRADLIPNLVSTVKGYATHEQETFLLTVEARAKGAKINPATATPEQFAAWQAAQDDVLSAINVVVEAYPELKASQNFLQFQAQLEGTENRIAVARQNYNEAVKEYNVYVRTFPNNLIASMFGFEKRVMFEAQAGAEVAPVVQF